MENKKTIGNLITEAVDLHDLNVDTVANVIGMRVLSLAELMNDECYPNNVPIILFKNLLLSLHIPFSKAQPAILESFKIVRSKETAETRRNKSRWASLWENEEAVGNYINRLQELMNKNQLK